MQRRCHSAHIVPNPSAAERNLTSVSIYDSIPKSHICPDEVLPSCLPLPQDRQRTDSVDDHGMCHEHPSRGYVCLSEVDSTAPTPEEHRIRQLAHMPDLPNLDPFFLTTLSTDSCPPDTFARDSHAPYSYPSPDGSASETSSEASNSTAASSLDLTSELSNKPSTARGVHTPSASTPKLMKQRVRQYSYVDSLVDVATTIITTLWPSVEANDPRLAEHFRRTVSSFVTGTTRKSKTSLSTMQLALFYCIKLKRDQDLLRQQLASVQASDGSSQEAVIFSARSACARRNFLSALILASKYLQDRNFSNKAWSKISCVSVAEINLRERDFLEVTKWNLDVKHDVFKVWSFMLEQFTQEIRDHTIFGDIETCQNRWTSIVTQMMQLPDIRMRHFMQRVIERKDFTVYPFISCAAQLPTPGATPTSEISDLCFPMVGATVGESGGSDTLRGSQPPQKAVQDIRESPFFEEFIECTPRDTFLGVDVLPSSSAIDYAAAQYATPRSLQIVSPLSEGEGPRDASDRELLCTLCEPPLSYLEDQTSIHAPLTPKVSSYPSFMLFSESFLEQQGMKKRAADGDLGHFNGTSDSTSLHKRRKSRR